MLNPHPGFASLVSEQQSKLRKKSNHSWEKLRQNAKYFFLISFAESGPSCCGYYGTSHPIHTQVFFMIIELADGKLFWSEDVMGLLEPLKNTLREKPASIRFRIHWPSWIRIRNTERYRTLQIKCIVSWLNDFGLYLFWVLHGLFFWCGPRKGFRSRKSLEERRSVKNYLVKTTNAIRVSFIMFVLLPIKNLFMCTVQSWCFIRYS
jgi:hypothetical protein